MPKLMIQQGYRQVAEFNVPPDDTCVGRSADNGIVIVGQGVSRHHIRIQRHGDDVTVADLGSRNGTFLNSTPVTEPTPLKHRDIIQIGDVLLLYDETETMAEESSSRSDEERRAFDLDYLREMVQMVQENIGAVVQGKDETIRLVILALLSDGHVLIEDVPGVGKTMLAQALAKSIKGEFKRIQFTPDLLPTDVTGVNVYNEKTQEFTFLPGPIFANVVLADEINRGSPRTQSSLLECMSEAIVTVDGAAHVLQKPFFVIATQNNVDFHGTYPLPEAQLDRFLMRLHVGYPSNEVERQILGSQVFRHPIHSISWVVQATDILQCQALVRTVHVSEQVKDYIVTVVEATRQHPAVMYGCSPRASLALMRASQSRAAMEGRDFALPRDVRDLAPCVLGHRLPLKLQARGEWQDAEEVVRSILGEFPVEQWERS